MSIMNMKLDGVKSVDWNANFGKCSFKHVELGLFINHFEKK